MFIGFTKMHGLGNDFVVIDNMNGRIQLSDDQIKFLCDLHKGIGADGVILVEPRNDSDCYMNYYNADGTLAEMCGNGVRCVAKFLKDEVLHKSAPNQTIFNIDTRAGIKEIRLKDDGTFSVNMGKPVFSHADFPEKSMELHELSLNFVSTGNPHAVAFVEDLNEYDILTLGPKIEKDKNFPNKINLELAQEISPSELKVKVWERGSGATFACGTGACGVYAVARRYRGAPRDVTIHLPGGKLFLSENEMGETIMRGPAESVYGGMVELK